MAAQGKFRKTLSLTDLTFIGLGSIFGSGWLFAASHVASMAGPAAWCAIRSTRTVRCWAR